MPGPINLNILSASIGSGPVDIDVCAQSQSGGEATGPIAIDCSEGTVVPGDRNLISGRSASSLTVEKDGFSATTAANWDRIETGIVFPAGKTAILTLKRDGVQNAAKTVIGIGVRDSAGNMLVAAINSKGTGEAHQVTVLDNTLTFGDVLSTHNRVTLILRRDAQGNMLRRGFADWYTPDGTRYDGPLVEFGTNVHLTDEPQIIILVASNAIAAGVETVNVEASYQFADLPADES